MVMRKPMYQKWASHDRDFEKQWSHFVVMLGYFFASKPQKYLHPIPCEKSFQKNKFIFENSNFKNKNLKTVIDRWDIQI